MTVYYNENDPRCVTVLRRHIELGNLPPGVVDDRDIRDIGADELRQYRHFHFFAGIGGFPLGFYRAGVPDDASIATGGFPCQDVSVAGRRAGLAGERSGLWFEFHRLLEGLKPEWVVIENVPGLLSSNGGEDFATVLRGLVELRYGACWRILDAQYFGVPQRRRRVFIVGHIGTGAAASLLFERESSAGDSPPRRKAGQGIACVLAAGAGGSKFGSGRDRQDTLIARPLTHSQTSNHFDESQQTYVASPIKATPPGQRNGGSYPTPGEFIISPPLIGEGHDASEDGNGRRALVVENLIVARTTNTGGHGDGITEDGTTHAVGGSRDVVAFEWNRSAGSERTQIHRSGDYAQIRASSIDAITYSLTDNGAGGNPKSSRTAGQFGVRRLTPTECERLQSFPDGWTDQQADSVRYRQLGNAVCVSVIEWLGQRLNEVRGA